jgi:hypothetical protein
MKIKAPLFFPDSEYLADKWWHRLATVIFWICFLLVAAHLIHAVWDIWEGYDYQLNYDGDIDWGERFGKVVIYAASLFLPSIVYRVMLFIGMGSAWKGTKGA